MASASTTAQQTNIAFIENVSDDGLSVEQRRAVLDKLTRRVVYFCMGIAFLAFVDRCNVGYAANDLCHDLELSHSEYGTAVSLFYIGYIIAQPPSNVMLRWFGAPTWFAFIVFVWGCVAAASAFIQSLWQFYMIRILLGLAEGGAFPGIFYYLGLFFPDTHIVEAYMNISAATSFSMPISSPIAAGLLSSDGIYGTRGWRNLFFVEGLIPISFSIVLFNFLPKSLETATFLHDEERDWLMKQQKGHKECSAPNLLKESLDICKSTQFRLLTYCWGTGVSVFVVLMYWISLIIQDGLHENSRDDHEKTCGSSGSSVAAVALTAIPYSLNGVLCLAIRTKTHSIRNRTAFVALVLMACSVLLLSWAWTRIYSFVFGFLFLTIAITIWSGLTFVMGVISTMFRPDLRSTAVALANGLGGLGSLVLPLVVGAIVDNYGYRYAIPFCAVIVLSAALAVFVVKDPLLVVEPKDDRV